MKLSFIISLIISQLIFLAAVGCSNDDEPMSCEDRKAEINEQREQIRAIAESSVCGSDYECRYIAFGNKPCGGPWEFLIYTTSIDTEDFIDRVNDFNNIEQNYNHGTCASMSNCTTPTPPIGFECVNNTCVPTY